MIFPGKLRRRLTIAFFLVAAVSGGVLAFGSYVLVRHHRIATHLDRSVELSRLNLAAIPTDMGQEHLAVLLEYFDRSAGVEAVVELDGSVSTSTDVFGIRDVPPGLRSELEAGLVSHQRTTVHGVPVLVTGSTTGPGGADFYFFFSMQDVYDGLQLLRSVLLAGFVILTVTAASVGWMVARRTLAPVRKGAEAARRLAEGLLDTRLETGARDEFGAWARYFNDMAEALQRTIDDLRDAHERERRFTADVAHELRTPLSSLVGAASMLAEHVHDLPREARRPAELVISGVRRLRGLTEDLIELSALDAGSHALVIDRVDIGAEVASTVRANGWDERVAVVHDPVHADVDRRSLDRIVGNLIGNALRHAGTGVAVAVEQEGGEAVVTVEDHGAGIPPEHLPFIFDRFHKVDQARAGGGGLGLAIAMENARRLDGRLEVESTVGVGSTFRLRLPAAPAGDTAELARPQAPQQDEDLPGTP